MRMKQSHHQEYTKELDHNKKEEIASLLKMQGSKSKFRSRIQLVWLYIIASAVMLIALLSTNYLVYNQTSTYYVPVIVCTIIAFIGYAIYFWRWYVNYKKIKEYVQSYWFRWYFLVLALTISAFIISFICTVTLVGQKGSTGLSFLGQHGLPIYNSILCGIIFDILFTMVASALDTYIIYHIEVDLQKLVAEYEENQIDSLKEKIKAEANKVKEEKQANQDLIDSKQNNKKPQEALSQAEIDELLHKNSLVDKNQSLANTNGDKRLASNTSNSNQELTTNNSNEEEPKTSTSVQKPLTQAEIDQLLKKNSNFYKEDNSQSDLNKSTNNNNKSSNAKKHGTKK